MTQAKYMKELQKAIISSATYWQDVLGLNDWSIEYCIDFEKELDSADAYVELTSERSHAVVSVSPDVELSDVDYLICHELLHVLKSQRKSLLRVNIEALNVDINTKASLLGVMNVIEEQNVNSIAKALVKARVVHTKGKKPRKKKIVK